MANRQNRFHQFSFTRHFHKGKTIKNILTSSKWSMLGDTMNKSSFNLAVIPAGMDGRPDLISHDVYGTPEYWWFICTANNIIDPFEQLKAGKTIKIPIIN